MFSGVSQVGVVVRDLEKTTRFLVEVFGIGPFHIIDFPPADRPDMKMIYRGEPANFRARIGYADLGAVELEVIQPLEGESVWKDFLQEHGEGIHHIRFSTFDLPPVVEHLERHGISISQTGSGLRPGTVWVYFDTEGQAGFNIEVFKALAGTTGRTPAFVDGKMVG
jgi:methylmalonyl-CoA/ethylmalonyl-CoA epimerase